MASWRLRVLFVAQAAGCTQVIGLEPLRFEEASDASTPADASAPADASDAPEASDGGAPSARCADGREHDFCENFETVSDFAQNFGAGPELSGSGRLALETSDEGGIVNTALRARIDYEAEAGVAQARISHQAPVVFLPDDSQPALVASLRLRIDVGDEAERPVGLLYITTGHTARSEDAVVLVAVRETPTTFLARVDERWSDTDGGAAATLSTDTSLRMTAGTWAQVVLRVNKRARGVAGGGGNLSIDGQSASFGLVSPNRLDHFRFDIGVTAFYPGAATWSVADDDLMLDFR